MRMNFVDSFVWDLSAIFNLFYRTGPKTFWTRNSSRNYCTSPSRSLRTNFAQFIHSFIVENIRICAFVLLCLCVRRLFSYKLFNHMVRFIKYVFTFSRFSLSLFLSPSSLLSFNYIRCGCRRFFMHTASRRFGGNFLNEIFACFTKQTPTAYFVYSNRQRRKKTNENTTHNLTAAHSAQTHVAHRRYERSK